MSMVSRACMTVLPSVSPPLAPLLRPSLTDCPLGAAVTRREDDVFVEYRFVPAAEAEEFEDLFIKMFLEEDSDSVTFRPPSGVSRLREDVGPVEPEAPNL